MEEKKMTDFERFEEAEAVLGESVPFGSHEVPNGTNNDKFIFIVNSFKDLQSECGSACKCYIECATTVGKTEEAKKEIIRLLSICSKSYPDENNNPKQCADEIVAMYAPVQDCLNPLQDDNHKESADIQRLKHLLDIIDRHSRGELTSEDVTELKGNCESWTNDIEKLAEMIRSLNMDLVV